jgi:hypothetical protein
MILGELREESIWETIFKANNSGENRIFRYFIENHSITIESNSHIIIKKGLVLLAILFSSFL